MRVCVLPPCYFPDKAYFQHIRESDACVILNGDQYAKRRRTVRTALRDGRWLTIPVNNPRGKKRPRAWVPICNVTVRPFEEWFDQHIAHLCHVYGDAVVHGHPIIEDFKGLRGTTDNLSYLLYKTTKSVLKYFNIHTRLHDSREFPDSRDLSGQNRLLAICKEIGADEFVAVGGEARHSVDPVAFHRQGIRLRYFESEPCWDQLSILDEALTWCDA